jgi:hypothetical protein
MALSNFAVRLLSRLFTSLNAAYRGVVSSSVKNGFDPNMTSTVWHSNAICFVPLNDVLYFFTMVSRIYLWL